MAYNPVSRAWGYKYPIETQDNPAHAQSAIVYQALTLCPFPSHGRGLDMELGASMREPHLVYMHVHIYTVRILNTFLNPVKSYYCIIHKAYIGGGYTHGSIFLSSAGGSP